MRILIAQLVDYINFYLIVKSLITTFIISFSNFSSVPFHFILFYFKKKRTSTRGKHVIVIIETKIFNITISIL